MGPPLPPGLQECVRAFEQEFGFVCRTLRRHGVPSADVPDLAQEVFIVMWRRWSEFDQSRAVRPWLAGIAWKVAGSHRRRRPPEVPLVDPEAELDPRPHGEDGLAAARARRLVLRALDTLPDPYRTVLVLHDIDGMPMREIAARERVPLFTAYTRLRRARHSFAEAVKLDADRRCRHQALLLVPTLGARLFWQVGLTAAAAAGVLWLSLPPRPARGEARALAATATAPSAASARPQRAGAHHQRLPPRAARPLDHPPPRLVPLARASDDEAPLALARGLTAHWPLDDAGGATARDLTGHSGDCLLRTAHAGDAWAPGRVGAAALELAGQGWLECPQPPLADGGAAELSVSAWVRARMRPRGNHGVVTRQLGRDARDHFFLGFINGQLTLASHSWAVLIRHRRPIDSRWHHLAFTRARDAVTLYLDGKPVGRRTIRVTRRDPVDTPLLIGGGSNRPGVVRELVDGAVDDVRLYDRTLGEPEVAALAAGTAGGQERDP